MRALVALLLVPLALAGCAENGSTTTAGFRCPAGQAVTGFDAQDTPECGAPWTGQVVTSPTPVTPASPTPARPPAKSVSLTSAGSESPGPEYVKNYTVASAATGLTYQDMALRLNGVAYTFAADENCINSVFDVSNDCWSVMRGTAPVAATAAVRAGDVITITDDASHRGASLQILDAQTGSIMLTTTVAS